VDLRTRRRATTRLRPELGVCKPRDSVMLPIKRPSINRGGRYRGGKTMNPNGWLAAIGVFAVVATHVFAADPIKIASGLSRHQPPASRQSCSSVALFEQGGPAEETTRFGGCCAWLASTPRSKQKTPPENSSISISRWKEVRFLKEGRSTTEQVKSANRRSATANGFKFIRRPARGEC